MVNLFKGEKQCNLVSKSQIQENGGLDKVIRNCAHMCTHTHLCHSWAHLVGGERAGIRKAGAERTDALGGNGTLPHP